MAYFGGGVPGRKVVESVAKKTDKAVTRLVKDLKKLRKQNGQLAKTLEKMREDQAAAHREILSLLEERPTMDDTVEPVEGDHTPVEEATLEPDTTASEVRAQDTVEPREDDTPDATEAAERRAKELGVDVSNAKGTGSGGRILVKDVEAAASGGR